MNEKKLHELKQRILQEMMDEMTGGDARKHFGKPKMVEVEVKSSEPLDEEELGDVLGHLQDVAPALEKKGEEEGYDEEEYDRDHDEEEDCDEDEYKRKKPLSLRDMFKGK